MSYDVFSFYDDVCELCEADPALCDAELVDLIAELISQVDQ